MRRSGESERQQRIREEVDRGYSQTEAVGRERAREAGYDPRASHGGPEQPGTHGHDRPGPGEIWRSQKLDKSF